MRTCEKVGSNGGGERGVKREGGNLGLGTRWYGGNLGSYTAQSRIV